MRKAIGLFIFFIHSIAFAVPSISSLTGTVGDGNTMTITGTDFYNHPDAAGNQMPMFFADFEGGTVAPDSGLSKVTSFHSEVTSCNSTTTTTAAEGTYAITSDVAVECYGFTEGGIFVFASEGYGLALSGYNSISIHRRNSSSDSDRSENWKWFRWAHDDDDFYPNNYVGESPDDTPNLVRENDGANTYLGGGYAALGDSWIQEGYIMQRESTNYGTDAKFYLYQNGEVVFSSTTGYGMNVSPQDTGSFNELRLGDDISNDREATTGDLYYDYVYIDTMTPMVIMFADNSVLASATEVYWQPYTAMSTTEITIEQKGITALGGNADNIYVFACKLGDCSSGVQLSSAGGGGGGGASSSDTIGGFKIFRSKS